jgi:hypothetical protein
MTELAVELVDSLSPLWSPLLPTCRNVSAVNMCHSMAEHHYILLFAVDC